MARNSKQNVSESTRDEMMAFIGVLYLQGSKKVSKLYLRDAWARDGMVIENLQGIMGISRFKFLFSSIRFDDKSTRNAQNKTDKLAPVREFFDFFVDNCKKSYTQEELTIDEKLEAYRGQRSFIQCTTFNLAKYGFEIFALADAKTYFTLNLEIYCGMQPECPYHVKNSS
ncbi:hypothetical protein AVEN_227006-1 [Araneus ventricosus]|uniref:PiggyBac transposable element-derived protein domain-containing protein n=1 Tax=Araneus ventricosus TaxID=182803 RepID=A0A4Y2J009_ARAVE|nr:hypothetical protein AVEN_227006-1 [Araneus ventricosus]